MRTLTRHRNKMVGILALWLGFLPAGSSWSDPQTPGRTGRGGILSRAYHLAMIPEGRSYFWIDRYRVALWDRVRKRAVSLAIRGQQPRSLGGWIAMVTAGSSDGGPLNDPELASPDSRWVLFGPTSAHGYRLSVAALDGTAAIARGDAEYLWGYGWMPDSRRWYQVARDSRTRTDAICIHVFDLYSRKEAVYQPRLPPFSILGALDSHRLLALEGADRAARSAQRILVLHVVALRPGAPTRRLRVPLPGLARLQDVVLSPSGRHLLLQLARGPTGSARREDGNFGRPGNTSFWLYDRLSRRWRHLGDHAGAAITDIQWIPSTPGVSFVHRQSLYGLSITGRSGAREDGTGSIPAE